MPHLDARDADEATTLAKTVTPRSLPFAPLSGIIFLQGRGDKQDSSATIGRKRGTTKQLLEKNLPENAKKTTTKQPEILTGLYCADKELRHLLHIGYSVNGTQENSLSYCGETKLAVKKLPTQYE